jgi:hypoxanthine phosphoribosyltransferase
MPSGHSEVGVIVCLLLLNLRVLKTWVAAVIILLVGLQRVYDTKHTLNQVIAGWSIGAVYALFYIYLWNQQGKTTALFVSVVISVVLAIVLTYMIDKKVHEPVPNWVDPSLMSIIQKKQDASYVNKFMYSMLPIFCMNFSPFYSWKRLEEVSDKLIEKLKDKKIDVIVGVKSGGAIVASYFHAKMPGTKLYYFKSKRTKKDDTSNTNVINDLYEKAVLKKVHDMTVVEGIDADISNKNVLLLDETIESGQSILFAKNYLETVKNVKHVTIGTININTKYSNFNIDEYDSVYYSKTENVTIWPWGYDN